MDVLRVRSNTEVKRLASAIIMAFAECNQIEVTAIGASAVNQAVKGIASANGIAATSNHILHCTPFFKIVTLDQADKVEDVGSERTAMVFLVTKSEVGALSASKSE